MKRLASLLLLAVSLVWLSACTKDKNTDYQTLDDETLARSIADDSGKQDFDPEQLPADAIAFLAEYHFESYYETVSFSRERGYEVRLATDERVYFNLRGRHLRFRGGPDSGPCGAIRNDVIRVADLRPAVLDYIATNYPDAVIRAAKMRGDRLIVLLTDYIILVFSGDGVFELDSRQWFDCRCAPGDQVDVPDDVRTMIANRLPAGEINRVCQRGDRIIVGVRTPDGRVILVFDNSWNFLFAHR